MYGLRNDVGRLGILGLTKEGGNRLRAEKDRDLALRVILETSLFPISSTQRSDFKDMAQGFAAQLTLISFTPITAYNDPLTDLDQTRSLSSLKRSLS